MLAVLLACCSAALFGAMTVALRLALRRTPDASLATVATIVPALAVAIAATAITAGSRGELDLTGAWPFLVAGILAPGGSQILFTLAVREAGPSRTSVAVGTAPLVSVAIALVALHEPARTPLLVGAVLVVAGGVLLVGEAGRPGHVRRVGLVYAFLATILFASRDNVVRALSEVSGAARPELAATATLLSGGAIAALWWARSGQRARGPDVLAFVPAGLCFGLSYVLLFEAYYRGRVTVVSPLVATESLWGVALSVLLLGRSELVGKRLFAGAALVVAGGVLIGAYR
ncbi:MAG: DMT family transporter [Gaiellaceae bacterium]